MGKWLVVAGLLIALIGLLVMIGLPLGRLPGDFSYRRGNTVIYVPLATSLLASVVLSLLFAFLRGSNGG